MRPVIFGAFLAVLGVGCGGERYAEISAPEPSLTWERHAASDGLCSAEFPQQWKLEETSPNEQDSTIVSTPNHMDYFLLIVRPLPPLRRWFSDEVNLELIRDELLRHDSNLEIATTGLFVVEGIRGREWEFRFREGIQFTLHRYKALVRDDKVYLMIAWTWATEKNDRATRHFLASFRFEKPKTQP